MPTMLPTGSPARPVRKVTRAAPEGLEIWAACVGVAATALACFIYFGSGDKVGAALILILAAVVVLAMVRAGDDPYSEY